MLLVLRTKKGSTESQFLTFPLLLFLIIQLNGFLTYTTWIRDIWPSVTILHNYDLAIQYLFGPLLIYQLWKSNTRNRWAWIHFVPAIVVFLLASTPSTNTVRDVLFLILQMHIAIYVILTVRGIGRMQFQMTSAGLSQFLWILVVSKAIHFSEFLLWHSLNILSETSAWVLFTCAEALIVFALLKLFYVLVTSKHTFSNGTVLPEHIQEKLDEKLYKHLSDPLVYKDPLINLQKVSDALQVAPHYVSKYINAHLGGSFVEHINKHRIESCTQTLKDPSKSHLSIQNIYYACGFNSKSAFNTAFKDFTGMTPSAYRKKFSSPQIGHKPVLYGNESY